MLEGLVVVEIGQVISAPYAGSILADLGAEVIKVERPGGEDGRQMGHAFRNGDSLGFQTLNRGKATVVIDFKKASGLAELEEILSRADVLIHNMRPGVAVTFQLDGPSVCDRHPRIIYSEISAFGHVGPLRFAPGYEPLVQAYSGICSINGGPEDPPMRLGISACDLGTGMWSVIGILTMVQRRHQTGRGGILNCSLLETALAWEAGRVDSWMNLHSMPERHASGHPDLVPYQSFEASDGPFIICCGNDRLFDKLATEVGHPEWITDERFSTNRARLSNKAPLIDELSLVFCTERRAVWFRRLREAGVPSAPIHSVPEALEEAQVVALGMIQNVPDRDFTLTGIPLSFDGCRPSIRRGAPVLPA
jgi:crotonobetainyl-CoA:carnitine CoA-transferase CaiB-like acyl-CoA transferase